MTRQQYTDTLVAKISKVANVDDESILYDVYITYVNESMYRSLQNYWM